MEDLLSAVLIWFFSIIVSIMSIIQTKGKDWYSPITNKQKMIMTIINVFVLFLVIAFMHEAIFVDIKKSAIISLVTLLMIIFFASASISKKLSSFIRKIRSIKSTAKKSLDEYGEEKDGIEDFKIKEHIQKLLTVFNCTFFLLNVIYIFVVTKIQNVSSYRLVIKEHSQIVAFVTVFWLALAGAIITSKEWNYSEVANFAKSKKVNKDANYFIKKIISRNR